MGGETVRANSLVEFSETSLIGPLSARRRDFLVVFRPETRIAPVKLRGTGWDLHNGAEGPKSYAIWDSEAGRKRVVGVVMASDIIAILQGSQDVLREIS